MVALLRTVDEDRGQNYSYKLSPHSLFTTKGSQLNTLVRFNYEVQNTYRLNITTTDSGNDSLTQEVVVSILDVNDAPSGIVLPQGTEIAENTKVSIALTPYGQTESHGMCRLRRVFKSYPPTLERPGGNCPPLTSSTFTFL